MKFKSLLFVLGLLGASLGGGFWTAALASAQLGCVGDCGGDGEVTVDEILTMVNIALGTANVAMCTDGDATHDSQITVDEILTAVNNALQGCQSAGPTKTPAPPTATPTRSPTMSSEMELFDVGANFFSIRKPKGWKVHIGNGVCTTLGILIRDPAVPLRQIFYFGTISPVYLKEQQRQIDQHYCPAWDESNRAKSLEPQGLHDSSTSRGYVGRFPILGRRDRGVNHGRP